MPYKIEFSEGIFRYTLAGHITASEFAAFIEEGRNKERTFDIVPNRITDMTGIKEMGIGHPEILGLCRERVLTRFPNTFRSAIVAREPQHVGYARMFQILNDNPQIVISIFPDISSAEEWVLKK
jgi:hypothetical protein